MTIIIDVRFEYEYHLGHASATLTKGPRVLRYRTKQISKIAPPDLRLSLKHVIPMMQSMRSNGSPKRLRVPSSQNTGPSAAHPRQDFTIGMTNLPASLVMDFQNPRSIILLSNADCSFISVALGNSA